MPARSSRPGPTVRAGLFFSLMRSVPAGSYERLSSLLALWQGYRRCRQGKRRQPAMARFDLQADQHLCALQRELAARSYQPRGHALRSATPSCG